ncbi:MAG: polysaccharide pyruvyl transferase family protein [Treponema sp.]|nr:polysaccharide pyruvyl transferase family protein [Treponema sp.]
MLNDEIEKYAEHGIVYLLAPGYSNIGDVAIFVQSIQFLNENARQPIKAILYSRQCVNFNNIRNLPLYDDDIIVIQGGGNMGSLYALEELLRQNIVKAFPNNKIISLPQSICFVNQKKDYILERAKKIYSNHKKLTIYARDLPTLDFCKDNFKCNIILCPDMVLSSTPKRIREYKKNQRVLLCLRKDLESSIPSDKVKMIENILKASGYSFEYWDTDDLSGRNIDKKQEKIQSILDYINQFQLVITDRYHGTILSYISQTPCIALDNCYGKVKNGFYWFKETNYMFFADDVQEIMNYIERIEKLNEFRINSDLINNYSDLRESLII